jgi:hypothetical protein
MLWPEFLGGAYRARSPNVDSEMCVNLYLETTKATGDSKQHALIGTPGLKLLNVAPTLGCRGSFSQDGRTVTVIGAVLYEVGAGYVMTPLGPIPNDGLPVTFASNGRGGEQLAICGGGFLAIFSWTTGTFTAAVSVPLTNLAVMVSFLDGYFLLLEANSIRVWYSHLENGLLWNALDFIARSQTADNLVAMKVLRDRLWLFGSQAAEIYYDSGGLVPFLPYPGSVMPAGLPSPWAATIVGDTAAWLALDSQGRARMVTASTYAPTPISTPAIDYALAQYPTLADCEVLAYAQEGHTFIAWTFPTSPNQDTWCYDVTESVWHQRAGWNTGTGATMRWNARGLTGTNSVIFVGDYANGNIYALDLETFTDNGQIIRRVRRSAYMSAENQWLFLEAIELGIQGAVGLATGAANVVDPTVMLNISRDSGNTWVSAGAARLGKMGEYLTRAIWRRLGRVRSDRLVIEAVITDGVRCVLTPGLWITAKPGTGAL